MCLRGWITVKLERIWTKIVKTSADSYFPTDFLSCFCWYFIVLHLFVFCSIIFSKARDHFGHMVQQIVHIDDEYVMSIHFDTRNAIRRHFEGSSERARTHTHTPHNYQVNKLAVLLLHIVSFRSTVCLCVSCLARSKLIFLIVEKRK